MSVRESPPPSYCTRILGFWQVLLTRFHSIHSDQCVPIYCNTVVKISYFASIIVLLYTFIIGKNIKDTDSNVTLLWVGAHCDVARKLFCDFEWYCKELND